MIVPNSVPHKFCTSKIIEVKISSNFLHFSLRNGELNLKNETFPRRKNLVFLFFIGENHEWIKKILSRRNVWLKKCLFIYSIIKFFLNLIFDRVDNTLTNINKCWKKYFKNHTLMFILINNVELQHCVHTYVVSNFPDYLVSVFCVNNTLNLTFAPFTEISMIFMIQRMHQWGSTNHYSCIILRRSYSQQTKRHRDFHQTTNMNT